MGVPGRLKVHKRRAAKLRANAASSSWDTKHTGHELPIAISALLLLGQRFDGLCGRPD